MTYVSLLLFSPILTIVLPNKMASSIFFIKAPLPTVIFKTNASAPPAIFLLIILLAIRGMLSMVPVTSLKEYIFLSAGARLIFALIIEVFISFTILINLLLERLVWKPLIDSILSIVPPVCPNPRPDILGTGTPVAATIGNNAREVLSPTPPVLCLSTFFPDIELRSNISPDLAIVIVKSLISRLVIPLNQIAI